ncbi:MAG: phosphotransferase [Bacillota bacterium]
MEHEAIIKTVCSTFFGVDEAQVSLVKRLMGGMSNYTYVITVEDKKYTFRIPGKNAEQFVDRVKEHYHLELIEPLNLNNDTVFLDVETGYKIATYIEGTPMHEKDPTNYLEAAANTLKKIHNSDLISKFDYDPFTRLDKYERLVKAYDYSHDTRYFTYKNTLLSNQPLLDSQDKVLCHGDAQISNFVITQNDLKLMDWEFTGNNDPFYDIACFGNNDFDHAMKLLPVYLGKTPSDDEWNRLYLWRTFQCLQWHNVALYKDFIGLSEDLHIDFAKVAAMYLDKAATLLAKLK